MGRRVGSAGSSAAGAGADEEGVYGSRAAGTEGGGCEGSSPGTDEAITSTSVGGDTMGDSDAETKELVVGLLVWTVRPTASIMSSAATTRSKHAVNDAGESIT